MIHIGICDDNETDGRLVESEINRIVKESDRNAEKIRIDYFSSGQFLHQIHLKDPFTILFLDIEMPDTDGLALAGAISKWEMPPVIMFVSAYESFVFASQEYLPFWFVRKGSLQYDLSLALRKYDEVYGGRNTKKPDIIYAESEGHRLVICWSDGKREIRRGSLQGLQEQYPDMHLMRVHKSVLVHPDYITEVGSRTILLKTGESVDMGRDRRKKILEELGGDGYPIHC